MIWYINLSNYKVMTLNRYKKDKLLNYKYCTFEIYTESCNLYLGSQVEEKSFRKLKGKII